MNMEGAHSAGCNARDYPRRVGAWGISRYITYTIALTRRISAIAGNYSIQASVVQERERKFVALPCLQACFGLIQSP